MLLAFVVGGAALRGGVIAVEEQLANDFLMMALSLTVFVICLAGCAARVFAQAEGEYPYIIAMLAALTLAGNSYAIRQGRKSKEVTARVKTENR